MIREQLDAVVQPESNVVAGTAARCRDSLRLAEELDNQAGKIDRTVDVLVQVNAAETLTSLAVAAFALWPPTLSTSVLALTSPTTGSVDTTRRWSNSTRPCAASIHGAPVAGHPRHPRGPAIQSVPCARAATMGCTSTCG